MKETKFEKSYNKMHWDQKRHKQNQAVEKKKQPEDQAWTSFYLEWGRIPPLLLDIGGI